MRIRPKQEAAWLEWRRINHTAGGYSRSVIQLTERLADALEDRQGVPLNDALTAAVREIPHVTAMMLDHALQNLANFWLFGTALLEAHNASVGAAPEVVAAHTEKRWVLSLHGGGHPRSHERARELGLAGHQ